MTDGTAFWHEAYRTHGAEVMAFLRSRLGSVEDAEELLQETFVRAIRTRSDGDGIESVRSYLFTVAHNLVRNHYRRSAVSPLVAAEMPEEAADGEAADGRARLRALVERLGDVLETLSVEHRQAFELAVLDRMAYRDVASRTGWSLSKVKINVYRARRRVIDALAAEARP